MGLIKAAMGAAGGVLADQWKEYFYCEAIPSDVLAVKGKKKVTGRSSNTKGDDNIITNGSLIAIADGQCMLIVEQGKVVDVCAEPGEYTYDMSTEPSIFSGDLGESVKSVFQNIGKRFTFGGEAPKDQRVYYFNTKELIDNKFGTPNPIPFRVVDSKIGLDIDVSVRCSGVYSYKIADPLLFYTNVCGNVEQEYTRDELDGQLKTELLTALQPAFAKISEILAVGEGFNAVIIGAGDLGRALVHLSMFEKRGVDIIAMFDTGEGQAGNVFAGVRVLPLTDLEDFCAAHQVDIGVITCPKDLVKPIAERLAACRVRGLWNYMGVELGYAPGGMVGENVHLGDSLMILNYEIASRMEHRAPREIAAEGDGAADAAESPDGHS